MYRTGIVQILLVIILCSGCGTASSTEEDLMQGVDSIARILVPDSRENLLSVDIRRLTGDEFVISGETNLPEASEAILDYLAESGVRYIDSLKVLPDTLIIKKKWGLITVSVANMKREPSFTSEMVSQAIMGTPVKILKQKGSWTLVQTPDYYIGWINDSGIHELDENEFNNWRKSKRFIFLNPTGHIFPGKDSNFIVSDIVSGSIVADAGGGKPGIARVLLPDGRTGGIARELLMDFDLWCETVTPEVQKMITFAASLGGSPYLWGGTSVKAIDCSGFTRIIYFTGGIILARDASQQFKHGMKLDITKSLDSLEPGDLLFFGYINQEGIERITHTGMYIGNTEVIHSSGMVRINSLDSTRSNYSSYLGKGLRGARRIIGTESARGTEKVALHEWYTVQK
jgi:gamma-D-glutamyl-L-lysine dipeptidyl-peptidase